MIQTSNFQPDWASPPGATIRDFLEERGRSLAELARDLGESVENAKKLLDGSARINDQIAETLSRVLGASAGFWLSRETQFRESLARLESNAEWLNDFPFRDMVDYGWIKASKNINDKIASCLEFFDVPTVADWYERYEGTAKLAAFRTSDTFTSDEAAVLAWLRKCEIDGSAISTNDWNREAFRQALPRVRELTRVKSPAVFLPELRSICAECGVAVVIARAPSGCRASGATRFLSSKQALLMLSFRYLLDDHFWFTFFHEAGHLVLHDTKSLFLEGGELCSGREEEEANDFAANLLIPQEHQEAMRELPVNGRAVMRFAREIGVSPGIVVGQMQHLELFTRKQLNNLKVRYSWS